MGIYMLINLINFDTKSLIGVLVWGNVATGIIVYLYQTSHTHKSYNNSIRNMAMIRFLSAAGYLLLFLRGDIPDSISVNIGNTLLYTCHYLEARLMFKLINVTSKKLNMILSAILGISIVSFNLVEFYYRDTSLRVGIASIAIFSIFLLPTFQLMISKESKFKRSISIFYILLLCALIPRGVEAFLYRNVSLLSNNYFQTLLFMSFILMMISNTIVYLLFMKEQSDVVIEKMATTDSLTGILNRYSFLKQGKQAFESHKSSGNGIALLFFDIDYFKKVNDQYGHQFGDEVLIRFADILKNNIRPNDLCCRYGGEEFVILLMNVTENISKNIATRIMCEIETYTFDIHPDFHITTSVGNVYGVPESCELLEDYIRRGDEALYEAKRTGRNKLVTYGCDE